MKYLVLETHPAYAVVLDEAGRFLRAANRGYAVGQTVEQIIPLRQAERGAVPRALWRSAAGIAAAAACFCLVFFGYYQPNYTAYGSLRMQINPDVELTLSRTERVLALEGLNDDGEVLIDGYDYRGQDAGEVAGDLVARAMDLGYLEGGDVVALQAESEDEVWRAQEEQSAAQALEERYGGQIEIVIGPAPEPILAGEDDRIVIEIEPVPAPETEATEEAPPAPPVTSDDDDDDDDGGSDDDDGGSSAVQQAVPRPPVTTTDDSVSRPAVPDDDDDDSGDDGNAGGSNAGNGDDDDDQDGNAGSSAGNDDDDDDDRDDNGNDDDDDNGSDDDDDNDGNDDDNGSDDNDDDDDDGSGDD